MCVELSSECGDVIVFVQIVDHTSDLPKIAWIQAPANIKALIPRHATIRTAQTQEVLFPNLILPLVCRLEAQLLLRLLNRE